MNKAKNRETPLASNFALVGHLIMVLIIIMRRVMRVMLSSVNAAGILNRPLERLEQRDRCNHYTGVQYVGMMRLSVSVSQSVECPVHWIIFRVIKRGGEWFCAPH